MSLSSVVEDDHETTDLPEDYTPTEFDAIVGWARQHYHHRGNQRLRDVVYDFVPQYLNVRSKTEKGQVISTIIAKLRRESPSGAGLVRQDPITKRWCYIGIEKAKDKIGHALRKASHDYRKKGATGARPHRCSHCLLPDSTMSSSFGAIDCTTTATPSTASSESDDEDEEQDISKTIDSYAHPYHASIDRNHTGSNAYYSNQYPYTTQSQSATYYHQHLLTERPHLEGYFPYSSGHVATSNYQHYYSEYGRGVPYPANVLQHSQLSRAVRYHCSQPVTSMPHPEPLVTTIEEEGMHVTSPSSSYDESVLPMLSHSQNALAPDYNGFSNVYR